MRIIQIKDLVSKIRTSYQAKSEESCENWEKNWNFDKKSKSVEKENFKIKLNLIGKKTVTKKEKKNHKKCQSEK